MKDDLISVVTKINTNSSFRIIKNTINWIVDKYTDPKEHKLIDEFMSLVVIQTLFLIENNIERTKRKDYAYVLTQLKNLFLSTRSMDPDLEKLRDLGEKIVTSANGKNMSDGLKYATRTAIILYIALRVLTGKGS